MAISTTSTTDIWHPDQQAFRAFQVIPDLIIAKAATVLSESLEGDAHFVRLPWVDDAAAEFVAEASAITPTEPKLAEVVIGTGKIAQIVPVSREQFHQPETASSLSDSVRRAIRTRANAAFISQPAPPEGTFGAPEGIITQRGINVEAPLVDNLDPLLAAMEAIETDGGTPSLLLASPTAWGRLRSLRTSTDSNQLLLGAGTEDATRRVLGMDVITSAAMPENSLLVLDPGAIAAAVGQVRIDKSEHLWFDSDTIALRATMRLGWGVVNPQRLATVTIGTAAA